MLPFRIPCSQDLLACPCDKGDTTMPSRADVVLVRVADAWSCLAAAELAALPRRDLEGLEEAYRAEMDAYCAATHSTA